MIDNYLPASKISTKLSVLFCFIKNVKLDSVLLLHTRFLNKSNMTQHFYFLII